jgi:ATP-dependent Clp protease ATP-binding subunit ClpA
VPFDFLSDRNRDVWGRAVEVAHRHGHDYVACGHFVLALLDLSEGTHVDLLARLGADRSALRAEVEAALGRGDRSGGSGALPVTHGVKWALEAAVDVSRRQGHERVGTAHLLVGIVRALDPLERGTLRGHVLRLYAWRADRAAEALCRRVPDAASLEAALAAVTGHDAGEG